jgi:hypothetical protein
MASEVGICGFCPLLGLRRPVLALRGTGSVFGDSMSCAVWYASWSMKFILCVVQGKERYKAVENNNVLSVP